MLHLHPITSESVESECQNYPPLLPHVGIPQMIPENEKIEHLFQLSSYQLTGYFSILYISFMESRCL